MSMFEAIANAVSKSRYWKAMHIWSQKNNRQKARKMELIRDIQEGVWIVATTPDIPFIDDTIEQLIKDIHELKKVGLEENPLPK